MRSTSRGASVEKSPSHKIPEQLRTPKVPQVDNQALSGSNVGKDCVSFTDALTRLRGASAEQLQLEFRNLPFFSSSVAKDKKKIKGREEEEKLKPSLCFKLLIIEQFSSPIFFLKLNSKVHSNNRFSVRTLAHWFKNR